MQQAEVQDTEVFAAKQYQIDQVINSRFFTHFKSIILAAWVSESH